uniref:G domain-containing protein n=1 Tax=Strongyloides venezuelensis TaxID=75913 RepID=A0A0K0F7A0_STRVS
MVCGENKTDNHCHTIKILDHECICCGEKVKKGKIILFDKSRVESDIILSDSVKAQIEKFENIISSNNNSIDITQSFSNEKHENFIESDDIRKTHYETHHNTVTTTKTIENGFLEETSHNNIIHHSNQKINDNEFFEEISNSNIIHHSSQKTNDNGFLAETLHGNIIHHSIQKTNDNDLILEKRNSCSSIKKQNSKHSINSELQDENESIVENNFVNDEKYVKNHMEVLPYNEDKFDNITINEILPPKHETEEFKDRISSIVNNEVYGSRSSLASSNVSNSTFKSNKSYPAPVPPTRSIYNDKTVAENTTENSEVNCFKKIEENNNIETFDNNHFKQDQQFIKESIQNELNKVFVESSTISKKIENISNNSITQNTLSENTHLKKSIQNKYKEKNNEFDNLAREIHSDVLLLSKKTKILSNLSKDVNNDNNNLSKDISANLNSLKEKNDFSEEIVDEKHTKTINHKTQSTTYYEIENYAKTTKNNNISNDRKSSISSSSDFTSSLKANVVNNDDLSNHLTELTKKKYNSISETINETTKISEENISNKKYQENLSSHFEPSIVGEPIDNKSLQNCTFKSSRHSTRTSLFEPSIYNEHIHGKNHSEKRNKSRQSNESRSTMFGIHRRNTPNSNIYGSEYDNNNDKLKYWKDKLVQESVIDETYEDLTLYKPKMTESICPITNTKKIVIGGESKIDECKTILLFGLPNSGKTSIVNRICNYLYGTDRSTLLRLVVKFPSELHQKQYEIITYQFNNSLLPYNLKIIDTPGCSGDDDRNQFTYKKLYHNYLKPIVNCQHSFTINAVLICLRFNSDSFNKSFNHQISGLKKIINGNLDSNNILSVFTDSDINYKIEAMKDFHTRQISKHNGLFLVHSKSYLNAKYGFSHLDYIRIFEQSESELFKLFTYLEFEAIPTKLIKQERTEIIV